VRPEDCEVILALDWYVEGSTMVRACRAALAAGSLLGKAAAGFVGILVIAGAIVPVAGPDRRARSHGVDPLLAADTVVLTVAEGNPSRTLTVVDASGRELATLTHWTNDDTAIVAPRRDGARVGCYLNARGSTAVLLAGTARQTRIESQPDGIERPPHDPERGDP
jgi:hypothetical protein